MSQQLTMTPQLQQAIRLLQLSSIELKTEIEQALEQNPLLESVEDLHAETTIIEPTSWHEKNNQSNSFNRDFNFESLPPKKETLQEYLAWQLNLTPFSRSERDIASMIIDSIQENGYLCCSPPELYDACKTLALNTPPFKKGDRGDFHESIENVRRQLQLFDPLGVASYTLQDSLEVQCRQLYAEHPLFALILILIQKHLPLVAKRDMISLAKLLKSPIEDLNLALECIQRLNPNPGLDVGERETAYIIPDAFVTKNQGEWTITLNQEALPQVRIQADYAALIKKVTVEEQEYIQSHLREARWFLKSLETRHQTLYKVIKAIVEYQKKFFEYGEEAMRPLILQDIASLVEIHESTVSRITSQKYIYTPRGMYELKYFFSSHIDTTQGAEYSTTAVKALLKKIIAAEPSQKPFSDTQLSHLLAEQGINIARRTISKYREALGILPSHERKRFKIL